MTRYTKNLSFFLGFGIWKIFCWLFTFQSVCQVYFLVVQLFLLPVIFTSRMFSNTEHRLEYFCYWVIRSNNIFSGPPLPPFIVSTNHSNADKIVCILLHDSQFYFNFHNASVQIHEFVQYNPNNPNSLSTTQNLHSRNDAKNLF